MFNKILVAFDRSASGQQVFDQALTLAKLSKATLMLLHVLSTEEQSSPNIMPIFSNLNYYPGVRYEAWEMYQQQWQRFEDEGLEILRSRTAIATDAGVNTEFSQNTGSPGRVICEMARNWGADLIIVGRRGRSGFNELILGSVSNYVLHHAPCSVLTVQSSAVKSSTVTTSPIEVGVMSE